MERLFFTKIELWLVGLLAVAGVMGTVLFGWIVLFTLNGGTAFGIIGTSAVKIAGYPEEIRLIINPKTFSPYLISDDRFSGKSGFEFYDRPAEATNLPFLLLNRFDGDRNIGVSELVDLSNRKVVNRQEWPVDQIWRTVRKDWPYEQDLTIDAAAYRFILKHALILSSGEIVGGYETPMIKADQCGVVKLLSDADLFHHAREIDLHNVLWGAGRFSPPARNLEQGDFYDDSILGMTPDGTITFQKSVVEILEANGFEYLLHQPNEILDPLHLNDVQPVPGSGLFWEEGDLFVSLRNVSMVFLYRPSSNRIVWHRFGPWSNQHDVDIISDSKIAIFDNNLIKSNGTMKVDGQNDVIVYDFATDQISFPLHIALKQAEVRTLRQGLMDYDREANLWIVEETEQGRLLGLDGAGNNIFRYYNRADAGGLYQLGWSRLVPANVAQSFLAATKAANCDDK